MAATCTWNTMESSIVAKTIAIMDGSMLIQVQILYVNADINKRFNFKELEVENLHLIITNLNHFLKFLLGLMKLKEENPL